MPNITLPTDGGNAGAWGPILNTAITAINNAVDAVVLSDNAKAADNTVVKLTGNQTVAGTKTFSTAPVVPDGAFAIAKTNGLQSALDAKPDSSDYDTIVKITAAAYAALATKDARTIYLQVG